MSPILQSRANASAIGYGAFSVAAAAVKAFESIATTTLSTTTASITFSSIPQTYKHLQIRGLVRTNRNSSIDSLEIQMNGTVPTKYHELRGDGSSASASSGNVANGIIPGANATGSVFGAFISDILDYMDTNKNKTIRTLCGYDANGSGEMNFTSSFNNSTSAITSITIVVGTGNSYVQYSHFALYGIKGA
jgi:hypothetical protein